MYLVINKCVTAVKVSKFSGQYLRNCSTLDIGVLGYIGIVQHKEHSPEVLSIPPGTPCIWSVLSVCYLFYALHVVRFQLFLSMINFYTRLRSLEDEGFPRMKAATPVSQASIILGRDVKVDTDDENLFEFPSDKKLRLASCRLADEEDEDIFAFADDIKPKSLQVHSKNDAVESSGLPRKRKSSSGEIMCEPSPFIKRRASEKDVLQPQNTDFCKNEPMEHSVTTHEGFLSVLNETKVRVFMVSPSPSVSEYSALQCTLILNFNLPS